MLNTAIGFFQNGGPFMYPIGLVLVVGLAVALERWIFLTVAKSSNRRAFDRILPLLRKKDYNGVVEISRSSQAPVGRIIAAGLARMQQTPRREEIELEAAYNQYMGNTSMIAPEKAAVREKLFGESFDMIGEGKKQTEKQYVVRVKDRAAGTQYWRKATRKNLSQLRSNPNIGGQAVEMSTYKKPYEEGEQKKKSKPLVTASF